MKWTKFATQIDSEVLRSLKLFAKTADKSISRVVSDAVAEYINKYQVRPAFKSAMDEVLSENEELLKRLAK